MNPTNKFPMYESQQQKTGVNLPSVETPSDPNLEEAPPGAAPTTTFKIANTNEEQVTSVKEDEGQSPPAETGGEINEESIELSNVDVDDESCRKKSDEMDENGEIASAKIEKEPVEVNTYRVSGNAELSGQAPKDESAPDRLLRASDTDTDASRDSIGPMRDKGIGPPQRSSIMRADRVKGYLNTDSHGNILPQIRMSQAGRYQARSEEADASVMFQVDEKSVKQASLMRWMDWTGHAGIPMMNSSVGHVKKSGGQPESSFASFGTSGENIDEEKTADKEEAKDIMGQWTKMRKKDEMVADSETVMLPAVTLAPEEIRNKPTARFNMTTVVKLKQLKKNLKSKIVTVSQLAKGPEHEKFIKDYSTNVAVEIPLTLKMGFHDEITHIIQATYKEYEKTLGKKHQLTLEAAESLSELKKLGQVYARL